MTDVASLGGYAQAEYIRASSDEFLYLTVLPTERCNFRCTYCYEDFKIGKMSPETERRLTKFLVNNLPKKRNVAISWFGGEPLLNKPTVMRISSLVREYQERYGFVYKGHVTTNGYYLDSDTFRKLVSLRVYTFQVTLDGWRSQHNATRKSIRGGGTFDQIWSNLLAFREVEEEFEVHIRVHLTSQNVASVWNLCDEIRYQFQRDSRFKINIERIKNLGGASNSEATNQLILGTADDEQDRLLQENKDLLPESLTQLLNGETYICYASMPNHYMIRADGSIGKCTVLLDDDSNKLGYLSESGELVINNAKKDIWTRGFVSLDRDELECPAINILNQKTRL